MRVNIFGKFNASGAVSDRHGKSSGKLEPPSMQGRPGVGAQIVGHAELVLGLIAEVKEHIFCRLELWRHNG